MKKGIAAVVVIAGVLLWKFVIGPQVMVSATNAMGAGWDDAKSEIQTEQRAAYAEGFKGVKLSGRTLDALAACTTDKAIAFLNTTDCSYLYNQATTSEQEHLAAQEKCFNEVGYEAKEMQFTLECTKKHFPNDWSIMEETLTGELAEGFAAEGMDEKASNALATCVVPKLIALMKTRKCALVNPAAQNMEELMLSSEDCFEDIENDEEFKQLFESCGPKNEAEEESKKK